MKAVLIEGVVVETTVVETTVVETTADAIVVETAETVAVEIDASFEPCLCLRST